MTDGQKDNCTNIQHAQHQIDVNMSNFINETRKFEAEMSQCNLSHCMVCRQYRLGMQTLNGVCSRCSSSKNKFLFSHENKALPTWTRDGEIMYDIPKELAYLTMAEKLLIQRVSPLVPVIHIKNGILGVRGHIVSFFQDISSIARVLPRLPSEVSIIKVIRDSKTRYGDELKKAFTVDRRRVMKALLWLKKYVAKIFFKKIDQYHVSTLCRLGQNRSQRTKKRVFMSNSFIRQIVLLSTKTV